MSIRIINGGMLTTVQDNGRIGYQQFGVPVSGAMDQQAAAIANILVGNEDNEAVLEVTMLGPRIEFQEANCIAVTGGDLTPQLDGKSFPMNRAVAVQKGQVLSFAAPRSGCRAYIAFAGGLDIPQVMGSRSTYLKAKIGGLEGRKLDKEDIIAFRAPTAQLPNMEKRAVADAETFTKPDVTLRVVLGSQDDAFTEAGIKTFLGETYAVTVQSDRMGCRLDGPVIEHVKDGNIISDGISFGAIQVPSEGKPIIMVADRQTVGGYTKIATVISADFSKAAQIKAGDKIRFVQVGITEAQDLYLDRKAYLRALREALSHTYDPSAGPAKQPPRPQKYACLPR